MITLIVLLVAVLGAATLFGLLARMSVGEIAAQALAMTAAALGMYGLVSLLR